MLDLNAWRGVVYRLTFDAIDWDENEHQRDKNGCCGKGTGKIAAMEEIKIASPEEVSRFLSNALADRKKKQPPIVIWNLSKDISTAIETLGALPRNRVVALDHDYTLHIHDSHGLQKEKLRGQLPIDAEDLAMVGMLLESASSITNGNPSHSRNGAMRIEVMADIPEMRYWIVFEVRKHHVVPYTMFKRKK